MPGRADLPFAMSINLEKSVIPSRYDAHVVRRLSDMKGQFLDQKAYAASLGKEDSILYEVYEIKRPEAAGELLHGISIVHHGRVGNEYYMTKGHFHTLLDTAELYYCLRGDGFMVMETPEGESAVEHLKPQTILYVPPRWAHRSVNTSLIEDLVTFFIYPGNSGHDYGSIERQGFRKLIIDREGNPQVIDNPRWMSLEER